MEKKKWVVWLMAMALAVTSVPVYAAAGNEGVQLEEAILTEEDTLTEENWYESVYFQEPEQRYPKPGIAKKGAREASLSLEESVVRQLEDLPERIDVSAYRIPVSQAGAPYFQILSSHPEFFYVEKSTSYSYSGGYILSYTVRYRMEKGEIPRCREELEREADLAAAQADYSLSDVEKALAVHDYLALHCEYDLDRLNSNSLPAISHSAYGALVNRMAVCDGYAGAFAYIMKSRFGIPCTMVSSSGMAHAWNMILIDNQWYHVDVTWDDPTRDLIGRARHNFFLISDSVISDSSHDHYGWESEHKATSTAYSNAFWTGVESAVIHHSGAWYYSKYDAGSRKVNLVRRSSLLNGAEAVVYAGDLWGTSTSYYPSSYMYLDQANGKLYFSTKSDLRRLNDDGTAEVVYRPSVPANYGIYGFTVRGSQLCYAVQNSPNLSSKQNVQTYTLAELEEPVIQEITGISAEDVRAVYDGKAKRISVKGALEGDVVRYALEGQASYSASQPEMVDAGTYRVSYRVERSGYQAFTGTAVVTIAQAVPKYTAPSRLQGSSGKTLASVALPDGFVWQTADTKFSQEGTFTYVVTYVPSDTKNYQKVPNIRVEVAVSCPGHRYRSVVTQSPTMVKKGLRTYTCTLCGDTYTEEIAMLTPQKPGNASGQKVAKVTASSLKFTWKKASGVRYELTLSQGKKKISAKDTDSNSVTFTKLKPGTEYSLKITPYRKADGQKVYAAKSATVKAATAPSQAKLSSLRKSGNKSARIAWKKASGASGYEVYMRTGKGAYKKIKTIANAKTVSLVKSGLKKGKTYSFRVRAYKKLGNKKVYGSYSSTKSIKIK